jgi:hypothetical protein
METKNSPFSTNTFQKIWKKHFIPNTPLNTFKFIDGIKFYKRNFPFYFNVGKNLTKGNTYIIKNHDDYKNKTFIIYDVLPKTINESNNLPTNIGRLKSVQYPGFLINLNQFKNINDYLLHTFSKNTRMKMRKFTKRLDECFEIKTKMFFGHIDKEVFDEIFENYRTLLEKRYEEKEMYNNNMQPSEWSFYKEVAYPLILEKKASLFVIYNKQTPIAITYNYHTEDTLIDAITVFDIDYSKFNLGYVNNLKLINWCFENNLKTLDYSKGYFDYKKRMCTHKYNFEYHIIYDKKSIISKIVAHTYFYFLEFKAYLRNKDVNVKFHKFTYRLKNNNHLNKKVKIKITKLDKLPNSNKIIKLNINNVLKSSLLNKCINDFLYLVVKPYNEIEVFELTNYEETYILSSDSLIQQVEFLK